MATDGRLFGRLLLKFDAGADYLPEDLSAAARADGYLFVASDERDGCVERLTFEEARIYGDHQRFPLGKSLALEGPGEVDVEALAQADGNLWVVRSHSARRLKCKGKRDDLERLAKVRQEMSRMVLGRVPVKKGELGKGVRLATPSDPKHGGLLFEHGVVDDGSACADDDADGFSELDGDCADGDALVFPGAEEILGNRIDDDCDGVVDPGHWDPDGDGVESGDCQPDDAAVFPGNFELDNGIDDNCDGRIDEGTAAFDDDGDGFTEVEGDCDDADGDVHPDAVETPDGLDEDCNTQIDEGTANFDDDGDGQTESAGDCDDSDAAVHPGASEVENGRDDDCDGLIDDGTSDVDADGWTVEQGDCDDANGWKNPEQLEVCDQLDNDCDGAIDDACVRVTAVRGTEPGAKGCDSSGATAPAGLVLLVLLGLRRKQPHSAR